MKLPSEIISDAIVPCMSSAGRSREAAWAAIGALMSAGYTIVPLSEADVLALLLKAAAEKAT